MVQLNVIPASFRPRIGKYRGGSGNNRCGWCIPPCRRGKLRRKGASRKLRWKGEHPESGSNGGGGARKVSSSARLRLMVRAVCEVRGAGLIIPRRMLVECMRHSTSTRSIASPSGDRWLDTLERVVRLRSRRQIPGPLISGRESYQVVLSFCTRRTLVSPKIVAAVSRSIEAQQGLPATRGARFRASQPKL